MLKRLQTALAQVKAVNTSEKSLNEIRQTMYSLHRTNEIPEKVYNNIFLFYLFIYWIFIQAIYTIYSLSKNSPINEYIHIYTLQ